MDKVKLIELEESIKNASPLELASKLEEAELYDQKETLERINEEKVRLEEEKTRMDSELVKLRNIKDALELISEYYLSLIEVYKALLNRIDNSVNFLMIRCISFAHKLVHEQMSIKLLPKSQQAEIMAMVTISKVLKTMVEKNITMNGKTEKISDNLNLVKEEMR